MTREERVQLAKNPRYRHFRLYDGFVSICTSKINNTWVYGVSFCSPEDKFSRPEARFISFKRMMSVSKVNGGNILGGHSSVEDEGIRRTMYRIAAQAVALHGHKVKWLGKKYQDLVPLFNKFPVEFLKNLCV